MTAHEDSYKVLIPYREPSYEMRRPEGPRTNPFVSGFTVSATSEKDAIEEAIRRFKQRATNSSVFWVREIDHDGIRVQRLGSAP